MSRKNKDCSLSRRDSVVKIAPLTAAACAAPWNRISRLFDLPSTPVEVAIFSQLNLTPSQCRVAPTTGSHNILDASIDALQSMGGQTILTGEQSAVSLVESLSADPTLYLSEADTRNFCDNPGVGSSPVDKATDARNLQMFVASGGIIVTADANPVVLAAEDLQHPPIATQVRTGAGVLAGITLLGAAAHLLRSSNKQQEKSTHFIQKNIPALLVGAVAALATGYAIGQSNHCTPEEVQAAATEEQLGRVPAIEVELANEVATEGFINTLTGPPPVMDYYEGLVDVRNLQMAYNLWRVIAESVGKGQTGVTIFEKHGNVHGGIEDLFLEGPEVLQEKLRIYMKKIATYGSGSSINIKNMLAEAYVSAGGQNQFDKDTYSGLYMKVQNLWFENVVTLSNYMQFFQETTRVGESSIMTPREVESIKRPPSTRALLFREMKEKMSAEENDTGPLSSIQGMFKSAMMLSLAQDARSEVDLAVATSQLTGKPRQEVVIGQVDLAKTPIIWFDQPMKSAFTREFYTIEGQQIVGCTELYGRVCPIVREFTVSGDEVIGVDKLLFGSDQVAYGNRTYSYSSNKPENVPSDYVMCTSISSQEGHTQTDRIELLPSTYSDAVYWAVDQNDPARINAVNIK